jgi:hypothetical protein
MKVAGCILLLIQFCTVVSPDAKDTALDDVTAADILKGYKTLEALNKQAIQNELDSDDSERVGLVLSPEQLEKIKSMIGMESKNKDNNGEEAGKIKKTVFEGTAGQHNTFPGDLRSLTNLDKMLTGQIESLLKAAGVEIPKNLESKLNHEKIQSVLTWSNMAWLAFNMAMRYLFGEGIMGGVLVALLLTTLFILLPMALKKRRERAMTKWLTEFYLEHAPNSVVRVPMAVKAYGSLRNGFEKMKKDCIRKYVTEQAAEPKKAK